VRFFVGITDRDWFDFLSRVNGLDAALKRVTLGNNPSSKPTTPLFIPKGMVSAEGIEPSTYCSAVKR